MGIELYFFYSSHPVPQLHSFSVIPLSIFPSPALSLSLFFPDMQFHYLLYIWLSLPLLQLWFSLLTLRFSEMLKTRLSPFPPSLPLVQLTHISFLFISSPCTLLCFFCLSLAISVVRNLCTCQKQKKIKNTLTLEHLRERKFALPYF